MFGFLNCNKPIGFSSRDVVNVVQGRLRATQEPRQGRKLKAGHCGTLDPLADGVLVVGVGAASKLVPYVHETSKRYVGSFRFGAESPTGDLEVEPTIHSGHPKPSIDAVCQACHAMTGWIRQVPPTFSAIKINGRRAYDLARQGHEVEVPPRDVRIDGIEILSYQYPDLKLDITCSTGTYIRSVGIDLAKDLQTVAVMTRLTRIAVGEFAIDQSVSIDEIRQRPLEELLIPAETGVRHLPHLHFDYEACRNLANGIGHPIRDSDPDPDHLGEPGHVAAMDAEGELFAILACRNRTWRPVRVFNAERYQLSNKTR